eukprot:9259581-Pyramimonas_sp.AAC.2
MEEGVGGVGLVGQIVSRHHTRALVCLAPPLFSRVGERKELKSLFNFGISTCAPAIVSAFRFGISMRKPSHRCVVRRPTRRW